MRGQAAPPPPKDISSTLPGLLLVINMVYIARAAIDRCPIFIFKYRYINRVMGNLFTA